MGKSMFLFAGAYDHVAGAEGDYEVIKILSSTGEIGASDAAVITKRGDGEVEVRKAERPTEKGAWIGLAATACGALAFPSLLPDPASPGAAGAGLQVWFGHLSQGMSRADADEIGELLAEGGVALIVVGIQDDAGRIEQTAVQASRSTLKHLPDADFDHAERDAVEAMAQA
jgi:uncharacterized membrane protein